MEKKFPELGMKQEDCKEMRWVESTVRTAGISRWNTCLWARFVEGNEDQNKCILGLLYKYECYHKCKAPVDTLSNVYYFGKTEIFYSLYTNFCLNASSKSSIYNLRFTSPATPKPLFIITPNHESQIRALVVCSKKHGLKITVRITVRSGGHDFEGLSYRANVPFVLIDLVNFRTIDVNIKDSSAWVQAGATLGEVYYRIAEKSPVHGFPAADHVLDARIINAKGEILDRKTMGEDLFWAIRGGGVTSFGVLLAWKIEVGPGSPICVTISTIAKTLEQDATKLVHKWQSVASYGVLTNFPSHFMSA
ncbi:hypothetical protein Scep_024833 [Stephania cephalantha]|uniref:FAD linked oxidase N-terminal domain-containing protein n=1 Tax=Stephania cephalantha TaxID=152367 RepID=A0AAP0F2M8_9MAGN